MNVNISLYHGDCLVEMARIPDKSVEMILADPPYGTTACSWDSIIPLEPLWAHYKRIIKPRGAIVLTASQPFTTTLIASNTAWFKYCLVWDKALPGNFLMAKTRPLGVHEDVCVFSGGTIAPGSKRNMTYNPQMVERPQPRKAGYGRRGDVYGGGSYSKEPRLIYAECPRTIVRIPNADRRNSVHPTQKPVALMEYLIKTYTNEGETILDNTMGSGTTGVACVNTGRHFIGIEKDERYFEIARQRIEKAEEEQKTRAQKMTTP